MHGEPHKYPANDRGLARLRAAIEADAELAGRTLVCVVPDHGRDAAPGAAGGLGASDGSAAHREVALVAEGPGIRRKGGRLEAPSTLDVAPTLARLLGVELDGAAGRPWTSILE